MELESFLIVSIGIISNNDEDVKSFFHLFSFFFMFFLAYYGQRISAKCMIFRVTAENCHDAESLDYDVKLVSIFNQVAYFWAFIFNHLSPRNNVSGSLVCQLWFRTILLLPIQALRRVLQPS
jgi:hypothetical protein